MSDFILLKCDRCGIDQVTFSHASMEVRCVVCGLVLAKPTGSKARILTRIRRVLE